ncbi:hypothetical protein XENTR_v10010707 [Xenopus tropicalis]|nr:hypothetical protein XENTR_v10010707 [Xenopus tropicalis]
MFPSNPSLQSVSCGGTLTVPVGISPAPDTQKPYPPFSDCTWTMIAPVGYKVGELNGYIYWQLYVGVITLLTGVYKWGNNITWINNLRQYCFGLIQQESPLLTV